MFVAKAFDGPQTFQESTIDFIDCTFSNVANMFKESNAKFIRFENCKVIGDTKKMFYRSDVKTLDLSGLDVSESTDFSYMFKYCFDLREVNFGNFNTSNAKTMKGMFYQCNNQYFKDLDLSSFDTSNVTDMSRMFYEVQFVRNLNISSFNTSKVTTMSSMFKRMKCCAPNTSSFDTSNVTDMKSMFSDTCVETLDLSNFNTSKVVSMRSMFNRCFSLRELTENFNTSNVTDMTKMFRDCTLLHNIYNIENWNVSKVVSFISMFQKCQGIEKLDLSKWKPLKDVKIDDMFEDLNMLLILRRAFKIFTVSEEMKTRMKLSALVDIDDFIHRYNKRSEKIELLTKMINDE